MNKVEVKTYLPRYQKAEWDEHREELGINSQSEFVRMMVEAGRFSLDREFVREQVDDTPDDAEDTSDDLPDDPAERLEEWVMLTLNDGDYHSWPELVTKYGYGEENISAELDDVLKQLQENGRVEYNGRKGYTLADGGRAETVDV